MPAGKITPYFNALVEHHQQGFLLLQTTGTILAANGAFCELLGMPRHKIVAQSLQDFFLSDALAITNTLKACLENKQSDLMLSFELPAKPAQKLAFNFALSQDLEGELFISASIQNITARRANEQALNNDEVILQQAQPLSPTKSFALELKESNYQLLKSQATAQVGSWKYNLLQDEISWSPEQSRIYGMEATEAAPTVKAFLDRIHPDDRSTLEACIHKTLTQGTPYKCDHRIVLPDKSIKYTQCSGEAQFDADGNIVGLFGLTLDITERKKAECSLHNALAMLQKVMDYSLDIICIKNKEGKLLRVGKACEIIWGYTEAELIGDSILNYILPEDRFKSITTWQEILQGNQLTHFENRIIRKNGSVAPMVWSASWSATEDVAICIARDATATKQSEQKLRQSEELFRSLVQNGSDLIGLLNAKGYYTYVSDSVQRILGYQPNEFIGSCAFSYIHPDDLSYLYDVFAALEKTSQIVVRPFRFKAASGEWRWIETILNNQINNPAIKAVIASSRDITARKTAEFKIIESEQKYRSLFDYHPDAVFSLNPEGRFITANPQVVSITGYELADLLGTKFQPLILPEFAAETEAFYLSALKGTPQTYETAIVNRIGYCIDLLITSIPIIINGEITGIYSIAKDISERKKAEQERQQLITRLEKNNKNLQQFNFIVSHNLRSPVANILGLTNMFNRQVTDAQIKQELIQNLQKSAQNLDSILLDLNQILSVRSEINTLKEMIYFAEIITNIKTSIHEQINKSKATFNLNFSAAPAIVTIKSYLHSIMHNLITNAIKYQSPERLPVIYIYTELTGNFICLTVQDNGLGIDLEKEKNHLFGLYKRFHLHVDGKGLGLHLVKAQTEALGGKIEVQSQVGIGSAFKVFFPQ